MFQVFVFHEMTDVCYEDTGQIKGGTAIQSPFASPMGCRGLFAVSNGYNLCQEVYCKEKSCTY